MKPITRATSVFCVLLAVAASSFAERPYAFRERLECVHERGIADKYAKPAADEFAFVDGAVVSIPECGEEVLSLAASDFAEYLSASMGLSASVSRQGGGGQVIVVLDDSFGPRRYQVKVERTGVTVSAGNPRMAAQALYHLEDLMNLRRAPFLKFGEESCEHLFSPRMTHSAWGLDEFPEGHVRQIAHAGIDAIVVFVRDVDRTKGHPDCQDVNSLIRRAAKWGVDTYLYSYVQAFAHPGDPAAKKTFDDSYGRVSAAYPGARGFVFVGESCEFPSKDERVIPIRARDRGPQHKGDTRPMAGYFPCRDYPAWVKAVSGAIRAHNPKCDIVFWTYNWGSQPYGPRMELIDNLPRNVSLQVTWEMFESYRMPNGYQCHCNDYTLAFAGPDGEPPLRLASRFHRGARQGGLRARRNAVRPASKGDSRTRLRGAERRCRRRRMAQVERGANASAAEPRQPVCDVPNRPGISVQPIFGS